MKKRKLIAGLTAAANLAFGAVGLAYEFVPAVNSLLTSPVFKNAAQQKILSTRPYVKDLTFKSSKPVDDATGFFDNSKVLTFKIAGSTSTPKDKLTEIVEVRCDQTGFGKIKCEEPAFSEGAPLNVPQKVVDDLSKHFRLDGFHFD